MADKFNRVEYVDSGSIRGGVLDPYNIVGYYTDQNKRTYCLLEPSSEKIVRIQEMNYSLFRRMVPITTLKSDIRTMRYLIEQGILKGGSKSFGKGVKPIDRNNFIDQCVSKGWATFGYTLKTSRYNSWRSKIRSQLSKIIEDRGPFYEDSTVNETVFTLKNHFRHACNKFGWSPNKMEQVCERAMQEFVIKSVMNA